MYVVHGRIYLRYYYYWNFVTRLLNDSDDCYMIVSGTVTCIPCKNIMKNNNTRVQNNIPPSSKSWVTQDPEAEVQPWRSQRLWLYDYNK